MQELVAWIQDAIVWCIMHHLIHHNFWSSFNVYWFVLCNYTISWTLLTIGLLKEWVSTRKCDCFFKVLLIDTIPFPPPPCWTWTKYIFGQINLDMSTKIETKSLINDPSNYMVIIFFNLLIWNIYSKSWYTSRYEDRQQIVKLKVVR